MKNKGYSFLFKAIIVIALVVSYSSSFSQEEDAIPKEKHAKEASSDSTKTGLFHRNKSPKDSTQTENKHKEVAASDSTKTGLFHRNKSPKDSTQTENKHKEVAASDSTKTGLFHRNKSRKDSTQTKKKNKDVAASDTTKTKKKGVFYKKNTTSHKKKTVVAAVDNSIILPDTLHQDRENSPLDIPDDRGVYIVANKGLLQMRILGSVRFSAFYDLRNTPSKNSFNTYEIPTGDRNVSLPNYYNSLSFSRLGFEVTRRTNKKDFFIRLEMDFAGENGAFRIRHAYGKYGKFIIGQTWSLLTNVEALPATVDFYGPIGAVTSRTPQVRYQQTILRNFTATYALEYSLPDFNSPDSVSITFVQTIPNITARLSHDNKYGSIQFAGIIAPITGMEQPGNQKTTFGYGVSVSGIFDITESDRILYQFTFGNAISHFINPFGGSGEDMTYDATTQEFKGLNASGGFISYGHKWTQSISSYFSFGTANILNRENQVGSNYNFSYDVSANAFWSIVEGLKVGLEVLYGQRFDIDKQKGRGSRIWMLFYYDF